jgi:hypothetical protein
MEGGTLAATTRSGKRPVRIVVETAVAVVVLLSAHLATAVMMHPCVAASDLTSRRLFALAVGAVVASLAFGSLALVSRASPGNAPGSVPLHIVRSVMAGVVTGSIILVVALSSVSADC